MPCLISVTDAMKTVLPHKARENDSLLSNLLGMCGDIRLVLTKSEQIDIDWNLLWKNSPIEENGVLEMTEKELESFGKCHYRLCYVFNQWTLW